MKFALYQPWIYLHGGLERSILELIRRSRHEWILYTGYYDAEGAFPEFRSLGVKVVGKTNVRRNFLGVALSSIGVMKTKLPLPDDTDGLVIWCDGLGDLATFRNNRLPIFNICSTPLRAVFDSVYQKTLTKGMGWGNKILYAGFKTAFKFVDRMAWKKFSGVVSTSAEVRARILYGKLATEDQPMVLAYPGIDWKPQLTGQSFEPFMLLSGRIMWTKNIELAIRAFLLSPPPAPWKLVIAGYVDKKSESYLAELKAMAAGNDRVEFVVSPSDAQLLDLNRRASFCLFTPLNEDWGIVPLEAMAQGKAVIANARGGPLESIVHDYTGLLVEPNEVQWNAAMRRLADDPALTRAMGARAHELVKRYSWDRFASIVDDALENWTKAASGASAAPLLPSVKDGIVRGKA